MAFSGNEVITLQFGHYSNYIGAHWWNCQEAGFEYVPGNPSEINHDVLFREGQTHRGQVTFTPRLLLVDLKGSLYTLPEGGRLYDDPLPPEPSLPFWPADKVTVQSEPRESKNEFLADLEKSEASASHLPDDLKRDGKAVPKQYHIDDSVKSWSDYLRPHLHPRSITLVQEYQHNNTSLRFDTFPQGQSVWAKPEFNEHFTDKVRLYLEEADNLQGFQVLLDNFDGFAGLGCAGVQFLRDEYPSKSSLCFSCQSPLPGDSVKADSVRVLNQALALSSLAEHSSLFVPISGTTQAWRTLGPPLQLPYLNYKSDLHYHTSAIVAAALDSLSLIYRLRSSSDRLSDLTTRFSFYQRSAAGLSVRLPFPLGSDATLLDTLEAWEGPLTLPLTPLSPSHLYTDSWIHTLIMRGVPESRLMKRNQLDDHSSNPAYSCRTLAQLIKTYLTFAEQTTTQAQTTVVTADSALTTADPFPHIFDPRISSDGHLEEDPRPTHLGVSRVPMLAGLHSSSSLGPLLESLHEEAQKINIKSVHQFADCGLETLELREALEQLLCLSECYSTSQTEF